MKTIQKHLTATVKSNSWDLLWIISEIVTFFSIHISYNTNKAPEIYFTRFFFGSLTFLFN